MRYHDIIQEQVRQESGFPPTACSHGRTAIPVSATLRGADVVIDQRRESRMGWKRDTRSVP